MNFPQSVFLLAIMCVASILPGLFSAFVFMKLWNWFVVPALALRSRLSFLNAAGMMFIPMLFMMDASGREWTHYTLEQNFAVVMRDTIGYTMSVLSALLGGWLAKVVRDGIARQRAR